MATENSNTGKFDDLANLLDAYEALSALISEREPGWVLLENLNRQFRLFLDHDHVKGLLT